MATVSGISAIKKKIEQIAQAKLRRLTIGLKEGAKLIFREADKIVPVDYGNLKASGIIRSSGDNTRKVVVKIVYTAKYAVYVHEDPDKTHGAAFNTKHAVELAEAARARKKGIGGTTGPYRHYRGVNQVYKFLERPFRANENNVKIIVATEVSK